MGNRRRLLRLLAATVWVVCASEVNALDDASFTILQAQQQAAQEAAKQNERQHAQPDQIKPSELTSTKEDGTQKPLNDGLEIDEANYTSAEELEEKGFNTNNTQRFFGVPDGLGRVQMVEQHAQLGLGRLSHNQDKIADVQQLAPNYHQIDHSEIIDALGMSCIPEKVLKKAKAMGRVPLGVWPLKPLDDTLPANYIKIGQTVELVQLISYASGVTTSASYYWPLVIFLDDHGCVLSGATQFFQQRKPATAFAHAALMGTIFVPDRSSYIMLTPLQQSNDLAGVKLEKSGQVQLKIVKPVVPE